MIFGTIKGFRPNRSLTSSFITVAFIGVFFALFGMWSPMSDSESYWSFRRTIYAAIGLAAFLIGIYFAGKYDEPAARWGCRILIALPTLVMILPGIGFTFVE